MPEVPFSLQCTIPEDRLIALKDSIDGHLDSLYVLNIPGIKYCLSIYPNGYTNEGRGKVQISLCLNLGNVQKLEADYTVAIKSANFIKKRKDCYVKSCGCGPYIAATEDFFNPEKKFIVDEKCNVKVNGIFKWETEDSRNTNLEEQKWEGGVLGDELWKNDDNKDLTIVVDDKEFKVHKIVLGTRSDVFAAMFESGMKETMENKMVIQDFSFIVVETAVKIIYDCNFVTSLCVADLVSLLQFFDKYQIPALKDDVESRLIHHISAATVCRLTNCSIISNSTKLKNKCIEFLEFFFSSKTPLSDIEILDKDVLLEVVQNLACQTVFLR